MIGRVWELGREVAERAAVARVSGVLAPGDGVLPRPVPGEDDAAAIPDPSGPWLARVAALARPGELDDAETVRRARVAARRLRTALGALDTAPTDCADDLRELGKRLGRIRDRDACLRVLTELPRTDALVDAVIDELLDRERTRRTAAMRKAARWLGRHHVAELSARIAAELGAVPPSTRAAAMARADAELRTALGEAIDRGPGDDLEALHAVRVMAKRLRYLQPWCRAPAGELGRAARQAQSAIGAHRDVALVHERLLRRRRRAERRGQIAAVRGLDRISATIAARRQAYLADIGPALVELRRALTSG